MQHHSITPRALLGSFWRNRNVILALIKREVAGRYRGSSMGMLWPLLNPILMLSVYTFMFSTVFKSRWSGGSDSKTEFALILFAGLIVFNIFAESIARAPSCILNNVNYVKKVVFPLEILPCITLGASLFHASISVAVWLVAYILIFGTPHPTALLLPLVLLPITLTSIGLSWALAALGVYIRDIAQVVGILTTALMFLSPVFYPVTALPEAYRPLMALNPLTPSIEQTRDILFWGHAPEWSTFSVSLASGLFVAWVGFACFQKARKGFADVL